jgi:hypothetical protein
MVDVLDSRVMSHRLHLLAPALAVAVALTAALGGCGGDDGAGTAERSTTSSSVDPEATTSSVAPAVPDGYAIDEAVLRPAVDQADELYRGLDGVDDDDYRAVLTQACAEVRSGAASQREPAATAAAIAAAVPTDRADHRFPAAALLATELYLEGSKCGTDATYATSVRAALQPYASRAFVEAAKGA